MRRTWGIIAMSLGVARLFGSAAFRIWAAPALVRFPLDVDQTARYTGTALTFVDQKTLLPFAQPKREPLSIARHVKVVSGTFDRAVIDEIGRREGRLGDEHVETYQYVIDRRSMKMVADPRQFAFGDPTAVMHAAGSYRVTFAMGTNANGTYLAYIPEEDAVSHLVLVEGPHRHSRREHHRRRLLQQSRKAGRALLPRAPEEDWPAHAGHGRPARTAAAARSGIDVNRALADVGPRLTPAESKLVTETLAKSVPLRYFFISSGPGLDRAQDRRTRRRAHAGARLGRAARPERRVRAPAAARQVRLDPVGQGPLHRSGRAGRSARPRSRRATSTHRRSHPPGSPPPMPARTRASMNLAEVRVPGAMTVFGSAPARRRLLPVARCPAQGLGNGRSRRHHWSSSSPTPRPSGSSDSDAGRGVTDMQPAKDVHIEGDTIVGALRNNVRRIPNRPALRSRVDERVGDDELEPTTAAPSPKSPPGSPSSASGRASTSGSSRTTAPSGTSPISASSPTAA